MATSNEIVKRALARLSILRIGKDPDADQLNDGLSSLNELIQSWWSDGVYINPLLPLPDKHTPAFIALLAMRLSSDYGGGAIVSPQLAREAENGWRGLLADYIVAPDAMFDSALRNLPSQRLMGQRGVPFNIATVLPSSAPSVSGFCTLTPNAPTTTVTDANCLSSSAVTLTPYNAAAWDEWHSTRPVVTPAAGSFVVTHINNMVPDRLFEYLLTI